MRHAGENFFREESTEVGFSPYQFLPDIVEQQVEEETVAAAWSEEVDRLRGWIVAG